MLLASGDREFCVDVKTSKFAMGPAEINNIAVGVQAALLAELPAHAITYAMSVMKSTALLALKGSEVAPLSPRDKIRVFFAGMIPFLGFGLTDNGLMVICGDIIEDFCANLMPGYLSTMGAAAWGNLISDVAGVFLGGSVQQIANRLGASEPPLTAAQRRLSSTVRCRLAGEALGVGLGCWLGMAPLALAPDRFAKKPSNDAGERA